MIKLPNDNEQIKEQVLTPEEPVTAMIPQAVQLEPKLKHNSNSLLNTTIDQLKEYTHLNKP